METKNLRSRLEAVKELKAEYGIGTRDALEYLRISSDHEELRKDIFNQLAKEGVGYRPSGREVSNLCGVTELLEVEGLPKNTTKQYNREFILEYCRQMDRTGDNKTSIAVATVTATNGCVSGTEVIEFLNNDCLKSVLFSRDSETWEELNYLYQVDSRIRQYFVAEREKTLGRLEVERRIALSTAIEASQTVDSNEILLTPGQMIDKTLNYVDQTGRLARAAQNQGLLRQYKYTRRAIIKNRKWLEKVLGN